ncbi:MAG: HD domain-containing phosphohydrolase [Planctomycetota bacterium]
MTTLEKRRILTVDDNQSIHEDYRKVLIPEHVDSAFDEDEAFLFGESTSISHQAYNYQIDSAFQGKEAIAMVQAAIDNQDPYNAAFVDVRMPPGIDGVETASRIWKIEPDLPIVLCTAYSDHTWEEIVDRLGHSDQLLILKKPFDNIEMRQMAASQTTKYHTTKVANLKLEQLEAMVETRSREIMSTQDMLFFSLAKLAESRDRATGVHLDRIREMTKILAIWLSKNGPYQSQLDEKTVSEMERSSVLHDIGKVGIPDKVLLKPGKLTYDEFEVMKTHAQIGCDAIEEAARLSDNSQFLQIAAEIARYHHEKFNGNGYPIGLSGNEIPLAARIVAVADVFDALVSERVYKKAMPVDEAREHINSESGSHFDPAVVDAFNACWPMLKKLAESSTNPITASN